MSTQPPPEAFAKRQSPQLIEALHNAHEIALREGHSHVGTQDMLTGLLVTWFGEEQLALANTPVPILKVLPAMRTLIRSTRAPLADAHPKELPYLPPSERGERALRASHRVAHELGHEMVQPDHLVLALLEDDQCLAVQMAVLLGIRPDALRAHTLERLAQPA
jgi:ATP-dependent Clp protease ATP-binding subunit ClpC